jgi:pyruvate/2-oxoglutarate dehydrogenase complex dihydrolipoamide dehydrogenase (E3) component
VNPLVDRIAREPGWFRNLSAAAKKEIQDHLWAEGRLKIEPWLESRVLKDGIKLWPRCQMADCIEVPDGSLSIKLDNGETVIADHVIAATGYEVNIANVPFLTDGNLLRQLAVGNGFAELDDHLQTNIPGLFITSMAAVHDFGPFWAFTAAARASAQIIGSVLHAGRKAARIGDGSNAV